MMRKILVVRFGSLGDVILTSATVLNLKFSFPHCHIVFLTKDRFRSIVERFDGVDEIVTLSDDAGAFGLVRLLLRLDEYGFDAVVDLHGNMRSWWTRKLVSAGNTVVYPKRRRERTRAVRRKEIPEDFPHTIDNYNRVLSQVGGRVFCKRPVIRPGPLPDDLMPLFEGDRPLIVVAPGAAHPTKQWALDRFAGAAAKLADIGDANVIWAVTQADAASLRSSSIPPDIRRGLTDRPIPELAAVLARADLTIANDSGIGHLSSAVGTPTVALFGPTHPVLGFAPRGLFDRVVSVDEPCRPCSLHGQRPCYRDQRYCFNRIDVDTVVAAASELLAERRQDTPALILDRDGTVIENRHYLADPEGVELTPGAAAALAVARRAGYKIVVVSNQSGVARGYHTVEDAERVNGRMLELLLAQGVDIDGVYFCPHHPRGSVPEYAVACGCRKPAPGMVEAAAAELGVDLRKSVVIGDSLVDVNLGRAIGARSILVRSGYGAEIERRYVGTDALRRAQIADTLADGVRNLLRGPI
jgi:histidinol-phosphate phosphatase family protein